MTPEKGQIRLLIRQKVVDALAAELPTYTPRSVYLPQIPGKALAVIGMRRSGKTTFLWQCLAERLKKGIARDSLLYFNFEDERLDGLDTSDLQWVVEEYYSLHPEKRDRETVTFFFDEIQLAPGWERFARRLMDTERVELFLSGSSARLLSREVATSMRGRGVEVLVHPFSFREVLRHRGIEPAAPWVDLPKAERSRIENAFRGYLMEGGFPEAQGLNARDRATLLQGYVDVAILRDVIERHGVSNSAALRWMQRHLLGNPASSFSVQKFHHALKSQGIPAAKDTLHNFLAYLEDAFLVRSVPMHSASERQRMVNPRKVYPVDPGLIPLYERTGRPNLGRALETAVLLELERRACQVGYGRTTEGYEVDFVATTPDGDRFLIQVCAEAGQTETWNREVRALSAAKKADPDAKALLLTYDPLFAREGIPEGIEWMPASAWLLDTNCHA